MERIKDTLAGLMFSLEAKKRGVAGQCPEENLKKLLTKRELNHIKFEYFSKGIVGISADSSAWLYHLNLRKEKLAAGLKKSIPTVKGVRLRLGVYKK